MKININKKQYRHLILMSGIAGHVLGILGDHLSESGYKRQSNELEEFENYLLGFAKDFHAEDLIEQFDGRNIFNENSYERLVLPIMEDYDEEHFTSTLVNKLAWRDFHREHTEKEIEAMAKENGGYFGVELHPYEERYWKEFEKHGVERFEIDEVRKKI